MSIRTQNGPVTGRAFTLLTLCAAISAATQAQTDEPAKGIEELVITGKYTTNERLNSATGLGLTLYETPQSVSVMTDQRLADQDLDSLTEIVINAPGVSAQAQDSTRHTFSARGFDINNYQVDGIPIYWSPGGNAGETQSNTAIYERVEIVRGATGLLTGSGNPSASINLVRKHADSRQLTGTVNASIGRWDTYGATADVSTPLNSSGSIRARVVGHYEQGESFRDLAEEETSVFYATADFDLTDNTLLRVGASRQDNEPSASTWGGLPVWDIDGDRTDWPRNQTNAANWTTWSSTVEHSYLDLVHEFGDWRAKLSVNNNVNASDQKLLYFGYDTEDPDTWLYTSPRNAMTERDQTSISFQLSGQYSLWGQQHDLTLGVVDHEDESFASSRGPSTEPEGVNNLNEWDGSYPQPTWGESGVDIDQTTEQLGIYGATRLTITEPFKVILGGRVAEWDQSGLYYGSPQNFGDDNVFIPYTGLLYEFNNQHTLYASYTEIFESQNLQDKNGDFLDPIKGESAELGLKSLFFDGALQTTVSVFSILQDNLGQPDGNLSVPGIENSQAYYEAEGAESEGYELEVVGQLTDGWDLSFSYTNFDAEDASGAAVNTNHPSELFKLYTSYHFADTLDGLTIAGGVNWQGKNYTDTTNPVTEESERLEQDAYSLVSLMARYRFTDQLSVQVNAKNLLDETYYSQIGFYSQLEYGEPRNVTASLNYQF